MQLTTHYELGAIHGLGRGTWEVTGTCIPYFDWIASMPGAWHNPTRRRPCLHENGWDGMGGPTATMRGGVEGMGH